VTPPLASARPVPPLSYALTQAARATPDAIAVVHRDQRWTWRQFDDRVHALAAAMRTQGIGAGAVVLVHTPNCLDMLTAMYACWRTGAIWAPTNFRILPDEIQRLAAICRPQLLICHEDYAAIAAACEGVPTWTIGTDADPPAARAFGESSIAEQIERHAGLTVAEESPPGDRVAWYFFTSGSSGTPKIAQLTHGQMGFVVTNHLCDLMPDLRGSDATLLVAPISHGAGVHVLPHVARGAKIVLLPTDSFDVDVAWRIIEEERISTLFTVPTILATLTRDGIADRFDRSSLRYVIYAGAPITAKDQRQALEALGPVLVQYYGLAEVTGNITVQPTWMHGSEFSGEFLTAGFERTGMQIMIRDEEGRPVPAGTRGEITVCGPAVFPGYLNNPEADARAFRDGWFSTGDLGFVDERGLLYITGRASDMYISGGTNIDPGEIEEKLVSHPEIIAAGVVGVPDDRWGEVGVALCVAAPGSDLDDDQLRAWCRERMSGYKVPKRIHFVADLPKSAYGKVTRNLLLERLRDLEEPVGSEVTPT